MDKEKETVNNENNEAQNKTLFEDGVINSVEKQKKVNFDLNKNVEMEISPVNEEKRKGEELILLLNNILVLFKIGLSRGVYNVEELDTIIQVYNTINQNIQNKTTTKELLLNLKNVLDITIKRGVFNPNEIKHVGTVYENLIVFINKYEN